MYRGFPVPMIPWLRCHYDLASLTLVDPANSCGWVQDGRLRCNSCASEYIIDNGIVQALDPRTLDAESSNELLCRDEAALAEDASAVESAWDRMEIDPTLDACEPLEGARVLELGAGTGRHTLPMARHGARILAVDFSAASLRQLSARIQSHQQIGLVQADCTQLVVEPRAFDLVACTLMSNLPTPRHRAAVMHLAARACCPGGRFVFGTHHYGVRSVLTHTTRSGNYPGAPIFRHLFTRTEITSETRLYFGHVSCHPIQVRIPFAARMGLPILALSRFTEHVPLVNELGELLLVVARAPSAHTRERGDSTAMPVVGGLADVHAELPPRVGGWRGRFHLRRHPFTQGS